jgi:branched-subunit amino acid transport protein
VSYDGPATSGILRVRLRLLIDDPLLRVSIAVAFWFGILFAFGPTALQAHSAGAGILGGASSAIQSALCLLPLSTIVLTASAISRDVGNHVWQVGLASGLTNAQQLAERVLMGSLFAMATLGSCGVGGALSGLGDSARQRTGPAGHVHLDSNAGMLVVLAVLCIPIGAATGALCASLPAVFVGVVGSLATYFPLVFAARGGVGGWVVELLPFSPVWSAIHLSGVYSLNLSLREEITVMSAWSALSALYLTWRTRRLA